MPDRFNQTLPEVTDTGPEQIDQLLTDPQDPRLKVVYFWGPQCPNCDLFKAALPGLLENMAHWPVEIIRANAYAHRDLSTRFGLRGIPTFYLYRDGKRLGRMSQYRGQQFFLDVIREHLPETIDR